MPNPKPGDAGYGSAPEGSLSEERAKKAAVWVEKEVFKLLGEIEMLGRSSGSDHVEITFGELFYHYQDVSDTLVGIMARAKKRGLIAYEGEGGQMLFQGKHDHVVVRLDKPKSNAWRKEYQSGQSSSASASPVEKKAAPTVKEQFEEEKKRRVQSTTAVKSSPTQVQTPPPAPRPVQTKSPEPVVVTETKTPEHSTEGSHAGFLATMMGKLLPPSSPKGSSPSETTEPAKSFSPPEPVQKQHQQDESSSSSSITKSIMANLSKLLPSSASSESLDEGVLRAVKNSATLKRNETSSSGETKREDPPAAAAVIKNTHEIPVLHAALPQRTRDGTRGAVLKTPPSPPKPARPVSAIAQRTIVSAPPPSTQKVASPASPTLKRDQEDWAKKHISRGVVSKAMTTSSSTSSSSSSAYAKLAQFQDPPSNAAATHKHKSVPPPSNSVSKVAGAFEKAKQSTTLPTGLQRRFAWE